MTTEKFDRVIQRADRIMRQLDERDGAVRDAARRERQRLNAELKLRAARVGLAIGAISVVTIVLGLILPTGIGMFGFLAAVGLAIGIAALLAFMPGSKANVAAPPSAAKPAAARKQSPPRRTNPVLPSPVPMSSAQIPATTATCPHSARRCTGSVAGD